MDILVKVKVMSVQENGVINLKHMTMCLPSLPSERKSTMVYFVDGKSLEIQIRHENFIVLLDRLFDGNLTEMENDE